MEPVKLLQGVIDWNITQREGRDGGRFPAGAVAACVDLWGPRGAADSCRWGARCRDRLGGKSACLCEVGRVDSG